MHISVSEVKEWYGQYYPGIPAGSLVPAKCFYCWQVLNPEDTVVIRQVFADLPNAHTGEIGVIKNILSLEDDGSLYLVQLDSGKEAYFIRAQLRKLRQSEVQPNKTAE